VLALAALEWWALRLVRRSAAPRWAAWPGPVIFVLSVASALLGVIDAWDWASGQAADAHQAIVSASIAEGMNGGAFVCFPLTPLWLLALLYFALRRRSGGPSRWHAGGGSLN
jgi:hypothetical protein